MDANQLVADSDVARSGSVTNIMFPSRNINPIRPRSVRLVRVKTMMSIGRSCVE